MQNTLVHAQYVPMDSQWAVFVPTPEAYRSIRGPWQLFLVHE